MGEAYLGKREKKKINWEAMPKEDKAYMEKVRKHCEKFLPKAKKQMVMDYE